MDGETDECTNNIRVYVRVRGSPIPYPCLSTQLVTNTVTLHSSPPRHFAFDHVGDMESTQEELFTTIGKPTADSCLEGFNGTIFAYGQTGSGKTYSMTGLKGSLRGLIPRVLEYVFSCVKSKVVPGVTFLCTVSYIEIYNEIITDLCDPSSTNLHLREDLKTGVHVEGLSEEVVASVDEAENILDRGARNRHVAATKMNAESSRSHSVFTMRIEVRDTREGNLTRRRYSRLHLIDLAGSERQKATDTVGQQLREAAKINSSLSALAHVINSLVEVGQGKSRFVHYRDSKLTYFLKDSLGGNSLTSIIACVSPCDTNFGETLSTLKFASRAKTIQNKPIINEESHGDIKTLQEEIKNLKQELTRYRTEKNVMRRISGMGIDDSDELLGKLASRANLLQQEKEYLRKRVEKMREQVVGLEKKTFNLLLAFKLKYGTTKIPQGDTDLEKNVRFLLEPEHNPDVIKIQVEKLNLLSQLNEKESITQDDSLVTKLTAKLDELLEERKKRSTLMREEPETPAKGGRFGLLLSSMQTPDKRILKELRRKHAVEIEGIQKENSDTRQDMKERLCNLAEEIDGLKRINAEDVENYERLLSEQAEVVIKLEKDREEMQEAIENYEEQKEFLSRELAHMRRTSGVSSDYSQDENVEKKDKDVSTAELEEKERIIVGMGQRIKELEMDILQCSSLKETVKDMTSENEELIVSITEMQKKMRGLEGEKEQILEESRDMVEEFELERQKIASQEQALNDTIHENEELISTMTEMQKKMRELEEEKNQIIEESRDMVESLELKREKTASQEGRVRQEVEQQMKEKMIRKLEEAELKCSNDVEKISQQLQNAASQLTESEIMKEKAISELDEAIRNKEQWILEMKACRQQEISAFNEMMEYKTKCEELSEEKERLIGNCGKLEGENTDLELRLAKLTGHQNLKQKIKLHLEIKKENNELKHEKLELSSRIEKKDRIIKRLESELRVFTDKIVVEKVDEEEERSRHQQERIDELSSQVQQYQNILRSLAASLLGCNEDDVHVDQLNKSLLETLNGKLVNTQQELKERDFQIHILQKEREVKGLHKKLEDLRSLDNPLL